MSIDNEILDRWFGSLSETEQALLRIHVTASNPEGINQWTEHPIEPGVKIRTEMHKHFQIETKTPGQFDKGRFRLHVTSTKGPRSSHAFMSLENTLEDVDKKIAKFKAEHPIKQK